MTPYFQTLHDFIHMNGHGAYVWTCYALVFGAILFMIWHAKKRAYKDDKPIKAALHAGQKTHQ